MIRRIELFGVHMNEQPKDVILQALEAFMAPDGCGPWGGPVQPSLMEALIERLDKIRAEKPLGSFPPVTLPMVKT